MYWKALICVILLLCHHPLSSYGYGEPDASGHPTYQERANHVFLNAVRISPSQYKTVYMAGYSPSPANILQASHYPAVAPVYLEPKLDASAYNHSNDMAVHNCFQHQSCDGTDPFVRIESFYTCNGNMGENSAAGYSDPLDTNNQWLCDLTSGACAADGSGSDGHRENIMNSVYKAAGVGYAYSASSTYKYYWTQDFGGAACSPVPTNPIYGGSHRVASGNTKFIAVYYTNPSVAPSSASVNVAGTSYTLTVDVGSGGQATYAYSQAQGSACRPYYFTIGSSRYPDTGCLVTYGEGTCTTSFDATCGGATTSAAVVSTSSATPAPTSSATSASTSSATSAATTATSAATTATSASTSSATSAATSTVATTAATSTTAKATTATSTTAKTTTTTAKTTTTTAKSTTTTAKSTTTTAKSSTTTAATTAAATTAAATTAAPTTSATSSTSTTGSGSTYYLYSSSLQNSWKTTANSGVTIVNPATYASQTALQATLTTSTNTMWFELTHNPAVSNTWTTLQFYAATSANTNIYVFFNGYYTVVESVTTSWQLFTIPFASLGAPSTLGNPAGLVFMNAGASTVTLYLYNVAFL